MTCTRCGILIAFFNGLWRGEQPEDCARCHMNGRLFERGCRGKNCPRCRAIDGGWREKGWP